MQPTNVSIMKEDVMNQLPKNIRQIGDVENGERIYMEDYVHTFTKKAQELAGNSICVGILLGKTVEIDAKSCMFVNGAILVDELKGDKEELQFTASVWKKIYEDIRTYFPQLMMQGWFVACKEDVKIDMIALERVHRNAFSQEESILYICNGEEISVWKQNDSHLAEVQGFYIYYEKNEAMQEYMIEVGQSSPSERFTKDETVQNFRTIMERRKSERKVMIPIIRGVGIISAAAVLFFVSNKWRFSHDGDIVDIGTTEYIVQAGADIDQTLETQLRVENNETDFQENQISSEETEPIETSAQTQEIEESLEDSEQVGALVNYYEIRQGDTLVGISMSFYGTLSMVEEICRLNHIENPNAIYIGQKIRLP